MDRVMAEEVGCQISSLPLSHWLIYWVSDTQRDQVRTMTWLVAWSHILSNYLIYQTSSCQKASLTRAILQSYNKQRTLINQVNNWGNRAKIWWVVAKTSVTMEKVKTNKMKARGVSKNYLMIIKRTRCASIRKFRLWASHLSALRHSLRIIRLVQSQIVCKHLLCLLKNNSTRNSQQSRIFPISWSILAQKAWKLLKFYLFEKLRSSSRRCNKHRRIFLQACHCKFNINRKWQARCHLFQHSLTH